MYYKHSKQSNIYSKRNQVNNATRKLFAWCFYELTTERKSLSLSDIEKKAYKDLFPDPYTEIDLMVMTKAVHRMMLKIISKVGDFEIVSPSLQYALPVAGLKIQCPIDLILVSKNKSTCWFFILDFNDRNIITETHNLYMPSIVIPANTISTYFQMPKNQIKLFSAKLDTGKLIRVTDSTSNKDEFQNIVNLVTMIKEDRIYKRVSMNCTNCLFNTTCFPSVGDNDN